MAQENIKIGRSSGRHEIYFKTDRQKNKDNED